MSPEPSTQRLDDLTFSAMFGILQCGMWLLNDIETFLRPFGLSHGRFSILLAIMEAGDGVVQPVVLARMLGKSKPAITQMIDRLKSDGLVTVRDHAHDRRACNLDLTQPAHELLRRIIPHYNERVVAMTAGLTDHDKQQLLDILGRISFLDAQKQIRPMVTP